MLSFDCPIEPLDDVIEIFQTVEDRANMKCTPTMFSIIFSQTSSPRYVAALQISPQYFTRFTCDQIHHTNISLDEIFFLLKDMHSDGFSSFSLSLSERRRRVVVALEFQASGEEERFSLAMLPTSAPSREEDVGEIDYSFFVSIDLEEFRRLVFLSIAADARVTLTHSQIKFSIPNRVIVLTKEREECIIGGIAVGEEVHTSITLKSIEFFGNFPSERVWFFKSNDGIILSAPMGLYIRISTYFPEGL